MYRPPLRITVLPYVINICTILPYVTNILPNEIIILYVISFSPM